MEVRTGGVPGRAHRSDHRAALHSFSRTNVDRGGVSVQGRDSTAVVDDHGHPVSTHRSCEADDAVSRSEDRISVPSPEVESVVVPPTASSEGRADVAVQADRDWPGEAAEELGESGGRRCTRRSGTRRRASHEGDRDQHRDCGPPAPA
jgi:hypothetical protein